MRDGAAELAGRIRVLARLQHATALAERAWHLLLHTTELVSDHGSRIEHLERLASIDATMDWIRYTDVAEDDLVSVIMVTRNRSDLVPRAFASLVAQSYRRWELVIVDDQSDPAHAAALDEVAGSDDRVRVSVSPRRGVAAGRNVGLDEARGTLVAYLDDDNHMDPLWLKAVVWAFGQRPDADVACGARLIDDVDRAQGLDTRSGPAVQFEAVDAMVLERRMQTDIGCIAHRSTVAVRFDERFGPRDDWDWLRRTLRVHRSFDLPCRAQTYTTDAPGRMSSTT